MAQMNEVVPPSPAGLRTRYCGTVGIADVGTEVCVCGWVARRREHGEHLAFLDVRDHTGVVQCVVDGASTLRSEYVVKVTGTVRRRPEGTVNDQLVTGEVEIGDCVVETLNESEPPPFVLGAPGQVDEAVGTMGNGVVSNEFNQPRDKITRRMDSSLISDPAKSDEL